MLRKVLGTLAGLILGVLVVGTVQFIGHKVFPLPEGIDPNNMEQIAASMDQIPFGALISVVSSWALGVCAGSFAAIKLSENWAPSALIVTGLLFLATVATLLGLPHPLWMMVSAPIVTVIAWFLAHKLAHKTT